jgi:hypothetical protein
VVTRSVARRQQGENMSDALRTAEAVLRNSILRYRGVALGIATACDPGGLSVASSFGITYENPASVPMRRYDIRWEDLIQEVPLNPNTGVRRNASRAVPEQVCK